MGTHPIFESDFDCLTDCTVFFMPPKILGRMGTNLKIGIVGLPNVGKSTFFNVLTKSAIPAENFPFCTIDPNEARVAVPDYRFDMLCKDHKPASKVPAYLNVVDISGLVKGANEGQGLGNAFLSHISGCDAIFHMLRVFKDDDITHVEGEVDPVRDIQIINDELRLKDLQAIKKPLDDMEKLYVRGNDKKYKDEFDTLVKVREGLEAGKHVRFLEWSEKEIDILNKHLFLTAKPMIYLLNMSKKDYIKKKSKWLMPIKQKIDAVDKGATAILFSAQVEMEHLEAAEGEAKEALEKEAPTQLEKIIKNGYNGLGLEYFFTAGEDEVRAWVIKKNTKAPQAAGRIHTDFEKGFIMAEVMEWDAWEQERSEAGVKALGKYRQQGKAYIVKNGDIIFFKFNTPNAPKKK